MLCVAVRASVCELKKKEGKRVEDIKREKEKKRRGKNRETNTKKERREMGVGKVNSFKSHIQRTGWLAGQPGKRKSF